MSTFEKRFNAIRSFPLCLLYFIMLCPVTVQAETYYFDQDAQTLEIQMWGDPNASSEFGTVRVITDFVQNTVQVKPVFILADPAREAMLSTTLLSLISGTQLHYKGDAVCPDGCDDDSCVSYLETLSYKF